ncbi:hypothetical protein EYF80_037445 [Liparis tanakae]|uniref:Uncharacterized protein n=1 Tax=Liparis tanakae TaxID=230148 RepID=A0A4Z2GI57_9TELE|nr:hypothetical protein EYF80_037445 [Liparis tanakae]
MTVLQSLIHGRRAVAPEEDAVVQAGAGAVGRRRSVSVHQRGFQFLGGRVGGSSQSEVVGERRSQRRDRASRRRLLLLLGSREELKGHQRREKGNYKALQRLFPEGVSGCTCFISSSGVSRRKLLFRPRSPGRS